MLRLGNMLRNPAQYQALEEGKSYRIFFVKVYPIHYILSVEPL